MPARPSAPLAVGCRAPRRLVPALVALVALAAGSVPGRAAQTGAGTEEGALILEFPRYNQEYRGLVTDLEPISSGALSVELSSPSHELTVVENRLSLWRGADGLHDARLEAKFFGRGELIAEIRVGSFPSRLEDRVTILEQKKTVDAVVRIAPHPEGYLVTAERLPSQLVVAIESELAAKLVSVCGGLSFFLGGRAACDELESLLQNARLSMPAPGTDFLVHRDYLTEAERARIDEFLAAPALASVPRELQ